MDSLNRQRAFVITFIITLVALTVVFCALSIFIETISGDLTRLGHWSEHDFGWRSAQPPIFIRANGNPTSSPRILVLGDSFSRSNIWQSFLPDVDGQTLSFYYPQVGCISNWVKWASSRPDRSTKTILIETVEREYMRRASSIGPCVALDPKPFQIAAGRIQPDRPFLPLTKDFAYLWETAMNTLQMAETDDRIVSGGVINVRLNTDKLFSNRRSDRLLFYRDDEEKNKWTKDELKTAAKKMRAMQDDFQRAGMHMIVIVVPDKSSTYGLYFGTNPTQGKYQSIMDGLAAEHVNSINLLEPFRRNLPGTVDLYYPDDTHLSPRGYRLMALVVSERLARDR